MTQDWESTFSQWAGPPAKTEEQRCENAINAIRNAIARSDKLQRPVQPSCRGPDGMCHCVPRMDERCSNQAVSWAA